MHNTVYVTLKEIQEVWEKPRSRLKRAVRGLMTPWLVFAFPVDLNSALLLCLKRKSYRFQQLVFMQS